MVDGVKIRGAKKKIVQVKETFPPTLIFPLSSFRREDEMLLSMKWEAYVKKDTVLEEITEKEKGLAELFAEILEIHLAFLGPSSYFVTRGVDTICSIPLV